MNEILILEESKKEGVHLIFDYFSCTFPFVCHADDYELLIVEDILNLIINFLGYKKEDVFKEEYALNRYKHEYTIANTIKLRLVGVELKSGYRSCMFEMKGDGCRTFDLNPNNRTWNEMFEFFLIKLNSSITRVDLTIDDYDGNVIDFNWLTDHLKRGNFISSFNDKKYNLYGNEDDGWTINFGHKLTLQQLVIYEKNKEQKKKNKRCIQDFWLRYEMRFKHEKAHDLIMNMLNLKDLTIKQFAMQRLYDMLDFKDESKLTYNVKNFSKNPTDPLWLSFLGNVEKAKMVRYKIHNSTYETYTEFMDPKVSNYIISKLLINNKNIFSTITDLIETTLKGFDKIDDKKINRINNYLKELGNETICLDDLDELRFSLEKEYKIRTDLPF